MADHKIKRRQNNETGNGIQDVTKYLGTHDGG